MKKTFTILGIVATAAVTSAQSYLFRGANFENWNEFLGGINQQYGIKSYAVQGVGRGVDGSNSLSIKGSPTANDYVFTSFAGPDLNNGIVTSITIMIKGTATGKSLSFNVYGKDGKYRPFNAGTIGDADVTILSSGNNQYAGSIDTKGKWVKVTLDTSSFEVNTSDFAKAVFDLKTGSGATYDLDIDNIQAIGRSLSADTFIVKPLNLIKNSLVDDSLTFGAKAADVTITNMNGQVVKTASVTEGYALPMSGLAKGMYIVSGTVNGQKVSQKIIKK